MHPVQLSQIELLERREQHDSRRVDHYVQTAEYAFDLLEASAMACSSATHH